MSHACSHDSHRLFVQHPRLCFGTVVYVRESDALILNMSDTAHSPAAISIHSDRRLECEERVGLGRRGKGDVVGFHLRPVEGVQKQACLWWWAPTSSLLALINLMPIHTRLSGVWQGSILPLCFPLHQKSLHQNLLNYKHTNCVSFDDFPQMFTYFHRMTCPG